jgi:ethanolamine ammonia-lyase small subunit
MSMSKNPLQPAWPSLIERIRAHTPARVLVDRAGAGYRTRTQLELRQAHAVARDAVRTELEISRDLGADFIHHWQLFEVATQASSKGEYLLRPGLGRTFTASAAQRVTSECLQGADLQIVIGDGLSVTAVAAQAPSLLPMIVSNAEQYGWRVGRPFVVRYCRVGIMNEVGELLKPKVVVLLIGERPGLATAESLSAYMAFRPRAGDNDARRNLVSNIHARGVPCDGAAQRIVRLAAQMMKQQASGVQVKETLEEPRWLTKETE